MENNNEPNLNFLKIDIKKIMTCFFFEIFMYPLNFVVFYICVCLCVCVVALGFREGFMSIPKSRNLAQSQLYSYDFS